MNTRWVVTATALLFATAVHGVMVDEGGSPFTDNGNGTITDRNTNLMWQKCSRGQNNDNTCSGTATTTTWSLAISYCEGLDLAGLGDWRLPNVKELNSIVDNAKYSPSINSVFAGTPALAYWSSTTNALSSTNAWIAEFATGSLAPNWSKDSMHHVRCVRGQ